MTSSANAGGDQCLTLRIQESTSHFWGKLPQYADRLCDLSLECSDGVTLKAHRLILSMASDAFDKMVNSEFTEAREHSVRMSFSSDVVQVFLEFVYSGKAWTRKALLPELLQFIHQWEVD